MDWLRRLFTSGLGAGGPSGPGVATLEDLARRLERSVGELRDFEPAYRTFSMTKRGGGHRTIRAPDQGTRDLQRAILRRVLGGTAHPAAFGFERGRSAVGHASVHAGQAVVVRMDIEDFFGTSTSDRVGIWLRTVWDRDATAVLLRLTTLDGSLPQGAPTSPALANRINRRLDARLDGFARSRGARYSRYADDITYSLARDDGAAIHQLIRFTERSMAESGYRMHRQKKLHVRRQYERQVLAGLVVNDGAPRLPRERRRWLRAVEHRHASGTATLTSEQLAGWRAYRSGVEKAASVDPSGPIESR